MADSAQDRTLPATPRKIEKARAEGQVARSRDLGHFAAFGTSAVALVATAPWIIQTLAEQLRQALQFDARALGGTLPMVDRLNQGVMELMLAVVPVGLMMVAVALAAGVASGGWNFSLKAIAPKWSKLNPISGVGNMFTMQQMGMTLKACLLALVLGIVGASFLWFSASRFMHTLQIDLMGAMAHAAGSVWAGVILLLLALGAFAMVDVPLQRFVWLRQLRMSHQDVKQEHKEMEGNPEIKARVRSRMREMANKRMLAAVPTADLVVMNPTHFAVALRYDEKTMAAPRVVAKGADLMALRIRDLAKASQVPVLQAPPLARALYAHAELDREIPAALFAAVAQVLAWVFQLRASRTGSALPPGELPPLPVPPELDPQNQGALPGVEPA
jgi:flagellar biosynthesis protein FlhB